MLVTIFTSLILASNRDLYNPVLNEQNDDVSYKAPLVGYPSVQFEKCPMTQIDLIVIERNTSGDLIAVREPSGTIEISLEKSYKRSGNDR